MATIKNLQSIEDIAKDQDLWVFGYGSLMWLQNFNFDETRQATLTGYHRDFCILSVVYRGTPENPGLALGLKEGGYCHGVAFKLSKYNLSEELAKIWAREVITK
ncbi:MAG: gamma-glutamylcyclotransferase [Cellvibrionaceae bacterium]|nr:gamma-glutamylcyclotransferase [Cellvibrionaceae bacterium]